MFVELDARPIAGGDGEAKLFYDLDTNLCLLKVETQTYGRWEAVIEPQNAHSALKHAMATRPQANVERVSASV